MLGYAVAMVKERCCDLDSPWKEAFQHVSQQCQRTGSEVSPAPAMIPWSYSSDSPSMPRMVMPDQTRTAA